MTKHLRLIMLSLFAMICMGGYSQSEVPEVTLDFSDYYGNPWKLPTNYTKTTNKYSNGTYEIILTPGKDKGYMLNQYSKEGMLQMGKLNASITLPSFNFDVEKIVVVKAKNSNINVTQNVYVDNVAVSTQTTGCNKDNTYQIKEKYQKSGNRYVIKVTNANLTYMSKIQIYKKKGDNRQDAGIRFAKDSYTADIAKGTFNEAELVNPNGLEVEYEITPKTEGVNIAQDGTVTYPAVDATYTVTAQFNGDVTYKPATATYTLNVVAPNIETRTIEFVAGVDKGNKGKSDSYTEGDIIEKDGISVNCDKARLGCTSKEGYRIYKDGLLTISTKIGDITKITFDDLGTADDLPNNLEPESGNYDKVNYVWTGKGKSIRFKVNVKAFLSKITVTVKVPVAKDYTLDENSVNTIEAYENANVTLKRTFYKDGEWNTLCLPFAVADAKTAFDNAELREVDTKNSHDNTIVFKKATAIEAGKPYLIKWANSSSDAVNVEKKFEGVTLVAAATPVEVNNGGISFNGFYKMTEARELGASVAAIGAENKLFKVTSGEMKGFRAAFVLKSNTPASVIKLVIDGTATGIEDLVIDGVKANGRVYNLNGQYVGNSLNGLQPGLYIQNGKKIVVK